MKSPKEKAKELIHKHHDAVYEILRFSDNIYHKWISAKKFALVTVDEILFLFKDKETTDIELYWKKVKEEIENYDDSL